MRDCEKYNISDQQRFVSDRVTLGVCHNSRQRHGTRAYTRGWRVTNIGMSPLLYIVLEGQPPFGLKLSDADGETIVAAVDPGSVAADKGIPLGSVVVKISDDKVTGLGCRAIEAMMGQTDGNLHMVLRPPNLTSNGSNSAPPAEAAVEVASPAEAMAEAVAEAVAAAPAVAEVTAPAVLPKPPDEPGQGRASAAALAADTLTAAAMVAEEGTLTAKDAAMTQEVSKRTFTAEESSRLRMKLKAAVRVVQVTYTHIRTAHAHVYAHAHAYVQCTCE